MPLLGGRSGRPSQEEEGVITVVGDVRGGPSKASPQAANNVSILRREGCSRLAPGRALGCLAERLSDRELTIVKYQLILTDRWAECWETQAPKKTQCSFPLPDRGVSSPAARKRPRGLDKANVLALLLTDRREMHFIPFRQLRHRHEHNS